MATAMMMVNAWAPPETGVPGTEFHANAGEMNTSISYEILWPETSIDDANWQTVPVRWRYGRLASSGVWRCVAGSAIWTPTREHRGDGLFALFATPIDISG